MKRSIAVWSFILIPLVILAIYIGETLTPETAALAMGAILGIGVAAVAILFGFLLRDERRQRQLAEARRPHPTPQAPPTTYIDAAWRELPPTQAPGPRPQLEAPTRAVTIRRS